MKAILEFNLPEDQEYFYVASKATELYLSLWDLDQWLRTTIKHGEKNKDVFQIARDKLTEIMHDHNVDLQMMS